jgi:RNA 3'-terminal phosphate cyclase (ATP)
MVGGLFQDFAPSLFHLQHVLLPVLRTMGVQAEIRIIRPGYVPRGGGEIEVKVFPMNGPLKPLDLAAPGTVTGVRGIALSSMLERRRVSERMAKACERFLKKRGHHPEIEVIHDSLESPAYERPSLQAGAALAVWATTDRGCPVGSDMAGARGRTAEFIGERHSPHARRGSGFGCCRGQASGRSSHPFFSPGRGPERFSRSEITEHVEARLWLAEKILHARTEVQGNRITIHGIGYRS